MVTRSVKATREHVRDTFARILERSPDVRTSVLGDEFTFCGGALHITHREYEYTLQVIVGKELSIVVMKCTVPSFSVPLINHSESSVDLVEPFFRYSCPASKIGKLRKMALILLKKMDHREIHDVMST